MKRNFSARRVLPPELVDEICRHISGCYLYIPGIKSRQRRQRDDEIANLYFEKGVGTAEIARQFYLSQRRVRQILKSWKERQGTVEGGLRK